MAKSNKGKINLALIVIVVLVLVAVIFYFFRKEINISYLKKSNQNQPQTINTSNWKTYNSNQHHFAISYPSSWTLIEYESFVRIVPSTSIYANPNNKNNVICEPDILISSNNFDGVRFGNSESGKFAGVDAKFAKQESTQNCQGKDVSKHTISWLFNKNNIYYSVGEGYGDDSEETVNKILSTFKFTN